MCHYREPIQAAVDYNIPSRLLEVLGMLENRPILFYTELTLPPPIFPLDYNVQL